MLSELESKLLSLPETERSKLVQQFERTAEGRILAHLGAKLLNRSENERNKLIRQFEKVAEDKMISDILDNLMKIPDSDPNDKTFSRKDVLDRIKRFTTSIRFMTRKNENEYLPLLEKGQVIRVNFTGICTEFDNHHLAIVWDVQDNRENLLVIPTTSLKEKKIKESGVVFNIGKLKFEDGKELSEETVVKIDQIMPISRKRIIRTVISIPGDAEQQKLIISEEQVKRVRDGFRVMFLGQRTLYEDISENNRHYLPEFEHDFQCNHLFRPFIKVDTSDRSKLIYRLHDDENEYKIKWHPIPKSMSRSARKFLLDQWAYAVAEFDEATNTIIKPREQVQREAFRKIKSHFSEVG